MTSFYVFYNGGYITDIALLQPPQKINHNELPPTTSSGTGTFSLHDLQQDDYMLEAWSITVEPDKYKLAEAAFSTKLLLKSVYKP